MSLFAVYTWILDNCKSLGYPLAVVFAFLWWNKTTPCPKLEAPTVTQAQTSTQGTHLVIKYVDRPVVAGQPAPLPCPEIDFSTTEAHWQSQSVTGTPAINSTRTFKLLTGLGYINAPFASLGVQNDCLGAAALFGVNSLGGQITWAW